LWRSQLAFVNDVRLTLEQAIPGGMSLEDYLLMREVIAAIREGLPEADQMQPGAVFQHVLGALRDCSKKRPKNEQFYLLRLNSRMILKADFTTAWRNHSQSNFAL
jgi:hypothetical protein